MDARKVGGDLQARRTKYGAPKGGKRGGMDTLWEGTKKSERAEDRELGGPVKRNLLRTLKRAKIKGQV